MTFNRRVGWRQSLNAAVLSFACMLDATPAQATSLWSTKLSFTAGISSAVVQGVVQRTDNLVGADGVPWTIYSLEVQRVLAGQVSDSILGIRCIGGRNKDGNAMIMFGAPRLRVGDTIIAFLQQGSLCQVSGLEYGVFWKRTDSAGVERLVDFRGRVLAAMGGDDIMLSAEAIAPEKSDNAPELNALNAEGEHLPASDSMPPPAAADDLIAELEAFSAAYVLRPDTLVSVVDLTEAPETQPKPPAQSGRGAK